MRLIALPVALGVLLGGCAGAGTKPAGAPIAGHPVADDRPQVINTVCPIGGDEFGDHTEASRTRSWNGAAIGFCCKDCVRQFDAMRPTQRDAVLARARANRAP